MTLGQRIIEIREQMGLSQAALAASAEVSHGYLTQLEKGEVKNPSAVFLIRLALALYVDPRELLNAAGYKPIREVPGRSQTEEQDIDPELLEYLKTLSREQQRYILKLLEGMEDRKQSGT